MEKYIRSLIVGIQSAMEYRANFLLSMVSAACPIFIQYFLWTAIYGGGSGPGNSPDPNMIINGYNYTQIIIYTVIANIVSRLVRTGFEYEINDDIKNGGLNKFIVKPVDYFSYRLACFIGQKLVQLLLMLLLIIGAILILALKFGLLFSVGRFLAFFGALLLAFILNYMIFFGVSMIAFWLTEVGFLFEAVRIVFIALSGGIFPLDIFGPGIARALSFLPFKYIINFPVEILNGRLDTQGMLGGLLIQAFWIIMFGLMARWLWLMGNKRYVAVGG
ncbi:MAG TPA: ABC-2 family transporter protein [Bacillota bacterium]|nr:ABC-2 family transporter protein [Bacillota bacterium]